MVKKDFSQIVAPWEAAHFVGGHIALDLANTVFHRKKSLADNELLKSVSDISSWCQSVGLISPVNAHQLNNCAGDEFVQAVQRVREQVWTLFHAISNGEAPSSKALGNLLRIAGLGSSAEIISFTDAELKELAGNFADPEAIPAALAMFAIEAFFTLPKARVKACPRCGWLFIDTSKGGRRRWCSMSTCGNLEKAARYRHTEPDAQEKA